MVIFQRDKPVTVPCQALFIHIPKCAGVAMLSALEQRIDIVRLGPHLKAVDIFDSRGMYKNQKYFVFTFVRNPWDRLVSTFYYIMRGGRAPVDQRRRDIILHKYNGNFKVFVLDIENWINIQEEDSIYPDGYIPHFRPQYEYICDADGTFLVDFIGKIETLDNDFQSLCDLLAVGRVKLKRKNKTSHKKYFKYYDDETRAIVARYYSRDIELFQYQFQPEQDGFSKSLRAITSRFLTK
jgi:hypothetical protein